MHLLKAWDFSLNQVPIKVRQQVENIGDVISIQNVHSKGVGGLQRAPRAHVCQKNPSVHPNKAQVMITGSTEEALVQTAHPTTKQQMPRVAPRLKRDGR